MCHFSHLKGDRPRLLDPEGKSYSQQMTLVNWIYSYGVLGFLLIATCKQKLPNLVKGSDLK